MPAQADAGCSRRQSGAPSRSIHAAAPEMPARYSPISTSITFAAAYSAAWAGAAAMA